MLKKKYTLTFQKLWRPHSKENFSSKIESLQVVFPCFLFSFIRLVFWFSNLVYPRHREVSQVLCICTLMVFLRSAAAASATTAGKDAKKNRRNSDVFTYAAASPLCSSRDFCLYFVYVLCECVTLARLRGLPSTPCVRSKKTHSTGSDKQKKKKTSRTTYTNRDGVVDLRVLLLRRSGSDYANAKWERRVELGAAGVCVSVFCCALGPGKDEQWAQWAMSECHTRTSARGSKHHSSSLSAFWGVFSLPSIQIILTHLHYRYTHETVLSIEYLMINAWISLFAACVRNIKRGRGSTLRISRLRLGESLYLFAQLALSSQQYLVFEITQKYHKIIGYVENKINRNLLTDISHTL